MNEKKMAHQDKLTHTDHSREEIEKLHPGHPNGKAANDEKEPRQRVGEKTHQNL